MARDAQRMNEQIAQDLEIARIHAEDELQMLIDGLDRNNETVANDEFPLPEQLPTAYEDKLLLLIQSDATVKKIALLLKTGGTRVLAEIDCFTIIVQIHLEGKRILVVQGDRPVKDLKLVSVIKMRKYQLCYGFGTYNRKRS
uniref:Uncharacterized protein n=1 Tax=Tanacetum cinerariifolium TaxID=118510 RepID=A0A699I7K7_TANCI|nr:hypothetical protein [Tanacetum cinerariifolium]